MLWFKPDSSLILVVRSIFGISSKLASVGSSNSFIVLLRYESAWNFVRFHFILSKGLPSIASRETFRDWTSLSLFEIISNDEYEQVSALRASEIVDFGGEILTVLCSISSTSPLTEFSSDIFVSTFSGETSAGLGSAGSGRGEFSSSGIFGFSGRSKFVILNCLVN